MASEKNTSRAVWALVGILTVGLIAIATALFSYATSAHQGMVQNRERISVIEARQGMMMDKLDEISSDVKRLLQHPTKSK